MTRSLLVAISMVAISMVAIVGSVPMAAHAAEQPIRELADEIGQVELDRVEAAVTEELSEAKYRLDRSFWQRVQEWLAQAWVRFLEWARRISEYVGGPVVLGLLVGTVVVITTFAVAANLGRRRARIIEERIRREHEAARGLDPGELERRASQAEDAGDYETAFRLLFRAGLVRLDRAGRIDLRPGTTSGGLAERLNSPAFDRLITRFDAVVYGGKGATPRDPAGVRQVMDELVDRSRV